MYSTILEFPDSRGLFSFAFTGPTSTEGDLCHGSKVTVLSMRGGYLHLGTECSPYILHVVWALLTTADLL